MSCKHAHEMADSYLRMITHINTYFIAYKFFMITQDDSFSSSQLRATSNFLWLSAKHFPPIIDRSRKMSKWTLKDFALGKFTRVCIKIYLQLQFFFFICFFSYHTCGRCRLNNSKSFDRKWIWLFFFSPIDSAIITEPNYTWLATKRI